MYCLVLFGLVDLFVIFARWFGPLILLVTLCCCFAFELLGFIMVACCVCGFIACCFGLFCVCCLF